ncbi:phosphatidate cytidylyltransferase [Adlercreutzia sp. ZJ141]|uniref:phosphatidate cytidylyltransferase n=1 Tax=Adlercreutzia sp. ZJ141 TaxID=2709406 RepID=UPI0013EC93C7|nr:phosphatidate cytidylyltransferase [Adlercreutzia sp. ZJ141]
MKTKGEGRNAAAKIKDYAYGKTPDRFKNASDLQVRFRTGFIYVVLSVVCLLASEYTTLILLAVTAGVCAGEFFYMLRKDAKLPNEILGIASAVMYPIGVFFCGHNGIAIVAIGEMIALLVWYVFYSRARIADVSVSFFGSAYCGLLLCGFMVIRMSIPGFWGGVLALCVFATVWANDSSAYLVGRKIGKHKMAPRISPKKSWEGFVAGLIGSMAAWCLFTFIPGVVISIPQALCFGLACGCAGVLGDFAESRIKRNAGFKDSGTIMPGHGGLLDRTDSLFLVSTVAAVLLVLGGCIPNVF